MVGNIRGSGSQRVIEMRCGHVEPKLMQSDQKGSRVRAARNSDQHAVLWSEELRPQDGLEEWFG